MANLDNIEVAVNGNKLTLTIDLSKKGKLSESKKNFLIASTRGNAMIEDVVVGLNVFRRNPDYVHPEKRGGAA